MAKPKLNWDRVRMEDKIMRAENSAYSNKLNAEQIRNRHNTKIIRKSSGPRTERFDVYKVMLDDSGYWHTIDFDENEPFPEHIREGGWLYLNSHADHRAFQLHDKASGIIWCFVLRGVRGQALARQTPAKPPIPPIARRRPVKPSIPRKTKCPHCGKRKHNVRAHIKAVHPQFA